MRPIKTKIGFLVLAGILLAFGLAVFFSWSKEEIKIPEVKSPGKITKEETADWRVYRNEEHDFEFLYPSSFAFEVCTGTEEKPESIGFDSAALINEGEIGCGLWLKPYGISLGFKKGPYANTKELIQDIPLAPDDHIVPGEPLSFSGYEFTKVQRFFSNRLGDTFYFVQYAESNFFLDFMVQPGYEKIAQQILSTFKFLE